MSILSLSVHSAIAASLSCLLIGCTPGNARLSTSSLQLTVANEKGQQPPPSSSAPIVPLQCQPRSAPDFIWGVTATSVTNIEDIKAALADLKSAFPNLKPDELPPIMVRLVLDPEESHDDYVASIRKYQTAVSELSKYALVMGELVDSSGWHHYIPPESGPNSGHNNYRIRAREFIAAMGDCVQIWEIGNEVNGEWTGSKPGHEQRTEAMRQMVGKHVTEAYEEVQKYNEHVPAESKKKTALTLFYNSDGENTCAPPEYEMRSWAEKYLDPVVKNNVNYLLLSYYENKDDCPRLNQDPKVFAARLNDLVGKFPAAKMGFGEVGYKATCPKDNGDLSKRVNSKQCIEGKRHCPIADTCNGQAAYLTKYYKRLNNDIIKEAEKNQVPFVGGYFYWFFVEDMTVKNRTGDASNAQRNRTILKEAMNPRRP